jgi:hypothetical protein
MLVGYAQKDAGAAHRPYTRTGSLIGSILRSDDVCRTSIVRGLHISAHQIQSLPVSSACRAKYCSTLSHHHIPPSERLP